MSELHLEVAEIIPSVGETGIKRGGLSECASSLLKVFERMERNTKVVMWYGKARNEDRRTTVADRGFFVIALIVEDDAEIGERFGIVRIDVKRAAITGSGLFVVLE